MKCFYHADLDGRCAAAVVLMKHPEAQTIELDYKDKLPGVEENEQVWIVDFSLQGPGDWDRLIEQTPNVTWIDHHATAINKPGSQNQLPGFRSTKDGSGALLTWSYVFPNTPVPDVVRLVSDFDTWEHKYPESLLFMYGMKAHDDSPLAFIDSDLFNDSELIKSIVLGGRTIKAAWDNMDAEYVRQYAFPTKLLGHSALAVNRGMTSSLTFGDKAKDYDLLVSFVYDGKQYKISVYSTRPNINVGQLLVPLKGGGHVGAGGFTADELPFE